MKRKTCPVCKTSLKKTVMLSDKDIGHADNDEDEWGKPWTETLLLHLDPKDLESCRFDHEVNIDICLSCETAFS